MDGFTDVLSNITLERQNDDLRFESGNVVVELSNRTVLVLHSGVLAASSPRFKARFSNVWTSNGNNKVKDPVTGEEKMLYRYSMQYDEDVEAFSITDASASATRPFDGGAGIRPFHLSGLASGYPRRGWHEGNPCEVGSYASVNVVRQSTIEADKLLFALLYEQGVQTASDIQEGLLQLTDAVALAEFYDLLPAVAEKVLVAMLGLPEVWKSVARFPLLFLALGKKLRSPAFFTDALRHIIGSGMPLQIVVLSTVLTQLEACIAMYQAKEFHDKRVSHINNGLRSLGLTEYQAHADRSWRKQSSAVKTTWLESTFGKKTVREKCQYLARSIFREFLDQQLVGEAHWSNIKYAKTTPHNGDVEAGSLRKACENILEATKDEREHAKDDSQPDLDRKLTKDAPKIDLERIGHRLAAKYAKIFNLDKDNNDGHHPAAVIAYELRALLRAAATVIYHADYDQMSILECNAECEDADVENYFACNCRHMQTCARHDDGLAYYTEMRFPKSMLPRTHQAQWQAAGLPAVSMEEATVQWMQALEI
ncbi:hypothetical protein BAUCODRAFT_329808 [Baudoinia panamericana UAMH 10762]|uniref:BTB domain-containing protein n=1 Tax=Baudoinia panamericana (strain UAMH 10762) TaxID=717646 RepID=M2LC27_BAUPA|nr:uncharacterized protein BAUCODRAFT_329808 [Baudoinia panamericana UAMH 10762]EMC91482.1 hypothetical protein BAUCODRAFT_329808 [Baudoinia panamericana UAMH 10762]